MRYFSEFAGIGGFDLAANGLGWEKVGYCENDKWALETYKANFGDAGWHWGDATTMSVELVPDFDILFAGFPCPPYSRAGKRMGMEDPRGKLFHEITRLLAAKEPRFFLLENVAGLTDENFRSVFWSMQKSLESLGYRVFTKVLNSADFGVPQHRERVFFVGFRDGGNLGEAFAWPQAVPLRTKLADVLEKGVPEKYYVSERLIESLRRHRDGRRKGRLKKVADVYPNQSDAGRVYQGDISRTLKGEAGGLGGKTGLYVIPHGNNSGGFFGSEVSPTLDNAGSRFLTLEGDAHTALLHSRGFEIRKGEDSHALKGAEGGSSKVFLVETANRNSMRTDSWYRLAEVADSLDTTGTSQGVADRVGYRVRRLTPRECARLQGFPDSFVIPVSDAQAYRQFGNAVTVSVVEAILRKMEPWLQASDIP
ncbi:MAG: DNA (cytosine-5-)-methyltransferase [Thaumarchaeota archaeon]|nr:DNA (cytosine-5-)-methyltransferase [Nitrososphaerota archaeon]